MALGRAGAAEGYWLRADRQTGGRGRLGRAWESPLGNLYASTLVHLRPGDPPAASLAFVAGLAAYQTLLPLAPGRTLRLKWPNDLLLDGHKCAGMLLERESDVVVLGIGINLAKAPDLADRQCASFHDGMAAPFDPAALMTDLANAFSAALARWRTEPLAVLLGAWEARAHASGTPIAVSLGSDERLAGRYMGLASDGALRLELENGTVREIRAADVEIVKERS